jgi:signal transduction histidine kinase
VGAALAARRLQPVVIDLAELTTQARSIGHEDAQPPARPMHVPETAALARALAALTARFAEARSRERRLAADLSHRLRTPLTALALDASVIGDGPAAERVRQTIASLDNDVDALIRAAPGEADTGPARCDVIAVVQRRMAFWSALAQHSRRSCEVRTAAPPATIALAEDDLAAVIDALLGNVFRHTPDGTGFAVSVFRHAGWISLVVDDAGPGVADPAAAQSRGVSNFGGTGLGLDIAREAVETTGGTIHIERAALGGARVRMRFAEADTEQDDPHEPRAWRLWRTGSRR